MDINAIEGILNSIKKLGVAGAKIGADRKIDISDVGPAVSVLSEIPSMIDNFKKFKEAFDESKDINEEEAVEIVKKFYSIGKDIEAELAS